jgi:two-component system, sensor histidine kinase LadS
MSADGTREPHREGAPGGPVLDPDAIRSLTGMVGDDPGAFVEIVDAFLDEAPERLAELRRGVAADDAVVAGRAAHTLKANGQVFGAHTLEALCRQLEAAARAGELADVAGLVDLVDAEWLRVQAGLVDLRTTCA